jgi:hypothetical protein
MSAFEGTRDGHLDCNRKGRRMSLAIPYRVLFGALLVIDVSALASAPPTTAPADSGGAAQPAAFSDQPAAPAVDCTPLPVKSLRCTVTSIGTNQFDVSCDKINGVVVKQREQTWCWAACVEMLSRYRGIPADQAEIVERIKKQAPSDDQDQSASQVEIWLAMNPEMQNEYDQRAAAWNKPGQISIGIHSIMNSKNVATLAEAVSPDVVIEELSSGNPVLLGLRGDQWGAGHIVLAYGATYSRLDPNEPAIYRRVGVVPRPASNSNTLQLSGLFIGARPAPQDDLLPHYTILSFSIVDPEPDIDPLTQQSKSQYSVLQESDLPGHLDFYIGRTEAAAKLKAYMLTNMPTPAEVAQAQQNAKNSANESKKSSKGIELKLGNGGNLFHF